VKQTIDNSKPIFQQIKEQIEDMIMNDTISETGRVPSTNEFAKYHKINPATAAKGINQLVEEGIIYKKRGVGMFVTEEAKDIVYKKRKEAFYEGYIVPLQVEARKLKISVDELKGMLGKGVDLDES